MGTYLGLKIAVVHLLPVAPMDRVENLHEGRTDALVVVPKRDALRDEIEEIAVAVVRDEVEVALVLMDFEELVHAGDVGDGRLDAELAPLVLDVVRRRTSLRHDFDCTAGRAGFGGGRGVVVDSEVDGAVGTSTHGLE